MDDKSDAPRTAKISKDGKNSGRKKNFLMVVYRWVLFLFSAVLSITAGAPADEYAVYESLAAIAIYNGAVTAYFLNGSSRKIPVAVIYLDILAVMLLILFSGGVYSELYVFLFFLIGLCGIRNNMANTIKTGAACAVLYAVTCILSERRFHAGMYYPALIVKVLLLFMAAIAVSGISYEVRKYDEQRKKEFRLARTDKLTGLANRHYFDQKLKEEAEYAKNADTVLNVLLFDIDDFKNFNDTYGHITGDKLLMLFSRIMLKSVRHSDIPVRYGGEEFLILIRDMDLFIAKSVGERIRRQLEKQRIYLGHTNERRKVTVSCGVAQFPTHSRNIRDVVEMADKALYYAKEIGKNIVVGYDEIGMSREEIENNHLRININ